MVADTPPIRELEARRPFPARLGPKGNLITTTEHQLTVERSVETP